ncbi:MAG: SDR family NAD(P)-dependent oxidoreductase [Candidatus Paceibacterota bacterium]|jgi:NAD(P)-dependent dehydrogenase (short-subunit alcohol dehydrogenase family)
MQTILITGVSKGIGQALAEKFLKEGYRVIGTSTTGTLPYTSPNLTPYRLDLSDPQSIEICTQKLLAAKIKIDILINNAGVLLDDEETKLNTEKLLETLGINVVGTADFTEKILPIINPEGHIFFLSSQAGSITDMDHIEDSHFPYHYPAYKISKAALNMYVRTLAARLKHEGSKLTISAVHPGWVRTDMGGNDAPVTPEEAANDIYALVISKPETGQFWYKGKKFPW